MLLYYGYKPGIGPVLKVMKYDDDEPLEVANTAYDRFYFNSENQKLAYVRDQWIATINWFSAPADGVTIDYFGTSATAKYSGLNTRKSTYVSLECFARKNNLFPDIPYVPMIEVRVPDSDGWIVAARRDIQWIMDEGPAPFREWAVYTSSQYGVAWQKGIYDYGPGEKYRYDWIRIPDKLSYMGGSDWLAGLGEVGVDGRDGNRPGRSFGAHPAMPEKKAIVAYWDLPADSSPMTTYQNEPNLHMLQKDGNGFILSRPGYSVASSAGTRHRILDSTLNLASVVMTGEVQSIAAGEVVTIPSGLSLSMAETSIVEIMVQEHGYPQYIPPHITAGYAKDRNILIRYKVNPYSLQIHNSGSHTVKVTYIVFNVDFEPQSTGGHEIEMRGQDNGVGYIQIKKPFTSDPATKASDVMLDTRLPTLQIIQEGFIPLWEFTAPVENSNVLGSAAHEIQFNNNGFIPYLKFTAVFEDRIMPPSMGIYSYYHPNQGMALGPPNKFSSVARLTENSVKFWLNPGRWAARRWYDGGVVERYYGGDPLGIRYYIFGIARQ